MESGPGSEQSTAWQQVVAYDWKSVEVPALESWVPTRSVSVVIPAYGNQAKLDRTLAALAHQRYPSELLEVIVADDGSTPPLRTPPIAPARTRIIPLERGTEWGQARGRHEGALRAEGDILLFLDSDMIAFPDHVAAHARWHHVLAEAVTLGHKLFADLDDLTPDDIAAAARNDRLGEYADDRPWQAHEWVDEVIEVTDQLTSYRATMFVAGVTATIGMRADFYRETGGFRTHLHSGEDMEFAYRLFTAGGVFIPEAAARSWHQGEATYMTRAAEVKRRNHPNFSNYVPVRRLFRPWVPGRQYAVPSVELIVTGGEQFERSKACVDSILAGEEADLRVRLCVPGEGTVTDMLQELYRDDPRVVVQHAAPASGFPARYTAFLPEHVGLSEHSLTAMVDILETEQIGLLEAAVAGEPVVSLWRTAALHRARRAAARPDLVKDMVAPLFGSRCVDAEAVGLVDLRTDEVRTPRRNRSRFLETARELEQAQAELADLRRQQRHLLSRRTARLAKQAVRRVIPSRARAVESSPTQTPPPSTEGPLL